MTDFTKYEDYSEITDGKRHHTDHLAFFDEPVGIQRYDVVRHNWLEKLNNQQLSFFWRPEEIDVTQDKADFESMSEAEQHIFIANLKRQIALDTIQGREPLKAFLPIASSPENEAWCTIWSFSELIHSRSYTHIIRGVLNDPSVVFDDIESIPEITELQADLSKYYDELERYNFLKEAKESYGMGVDYCSRKHKKAAYLAMVSVNTLEAIRFFVSFACSFAQMEINQKMDGNAKIIKLISRDESLHLVYTQRVINRLIKEDPEWAEVAEESRDEALAIFLDVVRQEKGWAKYLFKKGSMLGLNEQICCDYVDWIADKRARGIGLEYPYESPSKNPLPWMDSWLSSASKQTALQESENDSYLLGIVGGDHASTRKEIASIMEEFGIV